MFNNKKIQELENKVEMLENLLLVEDYFKDCPCCKSFQDKIVKSEAVAFGKLSFGWMGGYEDTFYTTKSGAKYHQLKIKEWKDQAEEYYKAKSNKLK